MPNWCNNGITLKHKDPAMIDRAYKALCKGEFLQEFIPTPKELTETVAGFPGEDKREAHEAQVAANLEKFGHKDWYSFQTSNWGTKWDVGGDDGLIQKLDDNTLEASFDSAWAPPCVAYERLIEMGFYIKAHYYEPGMGFVGIWEGDMEDGFFDDYYEISGETSKTIRDTVGGEIDDYWNLSESFAEYEDSEKDDVQLWYEDGVEKLEQK